MNPRNSLILVGLVLLLGFSLAEYIPSLGCWTYPDKLVCLQPSEVNTTAYIKDVKCLSLDIYGTGSWTILPCFANATLKETHVEVCYKMLPYKNGQPVLSEYNPRYNCHEEVWSGEAQLQIPRGLIPWECQDQMINNYTKECDLEVNGWYRIYGFGNDDNGTKVIRVYRIEEEKSYWWAIAIAVIVIIALAYLVKKRKS